MDMIGKIPRRHLLVGMAQVGILSVFGIRALAQGITPEQVGGRSDGPDDTDMLVQALERCRLTGQALILGDRVYRHRANLVSEGVSIYGSGSRSELAALDSFASSLIVRGDGVVLQGFTKRSPARQRKAGSNGIVLEGATRFAVRNVVVIGASGAGLVVRGASGGSVGPGVEVRDTMADGVHFTKGAHDVVVQSVTCRNTGDDGFAVVSYRAQGALCSNIRFSDCVTIDAQARGFAVVGGAQITITNPVVERSAAAGLYLYGERSYDTYGVEGCRISGGKLIDCVFAPGRRGYAVITLGGREGSDRVSGRQLSRGCVDCEVSDIVISRMGPGANGLVSANAATRGCVVLGRSRQAEQLLRAVGGGFVRDLGRGNRIAITS
jgi:hypothetical protein